MTDKLSKKNSFSSLFRPFFGNPWGDFFTELYNYPFPQENEKECLITFDAPGFKENELKIELKEGILTISGETKVGSSTRSIYKSTYIREDIDIDKITAKLENGVLTLTLPKREENEPEVKAISINAKE